MTAIPDQAAPRDAFEAVAPDTGGLARLRRARAQAGTPLVFASVVVHESLPEAAETWRALQAIAPASPYQTLAWVSAWNETEGAAMGVRPLIGVARNEQGRPIALLPLGVVRRGLVGVAGFLGGRHANYNLGLFDPSVTWTTGEVARLVEAIAEAAPCRFDMLALINQPLRWGDWPNPLAMLPSQASPSQGHRADLVPDGEAFLKTHLSAAGRKKMRGKATQLEALGPVSHLVARTPAEIERVLDAHLDQKLTKLASIGVAPRRDGSALKALLGRAARAGAGGEAALELHALLCGERVVATFGGMAHAGRFSGLLISHDAAPEFSRLSPGELLLAAVIRQKCAAGCASFDLGIGEARYKQAFCPIDDPLLDCFVPMTPRGRLLVAAEALRGRAKGHIKQSAWAWPLFIRLRKALATVRRLG